MRTLGKYVPPNSENVKVALHAESLHTLVGPLSKVWHMGDTS